MEGRDVCQRAAGISLARRGNESQNRIVAAQIIGSSPITKQGEKGISNAKAYPYLSLELLPVGSGTEGPSSDMVHPAWDNCEHCIVLHHLFCFFGDVS